MGRRWRGGARSVVPGVIALAVAGLLAGCDQIPEAGVGRGDIRNAIARGQLASPRAATVALVSLEGAPAAVDARFRQALTGEAVNREISITDVASARYLVRAYFSAYPSEGGVTVASVFDLFDAGRKVRIQRVDDAVQVPATAADPWGSVGEDVVASLASRSADDLAVALAGTPEAQAATVASTGAAPPVQ